MNYSRKDTGFGFEKNDFGWGRYCPNDKKLMELKK
jgi:hypothetical protein